MNSDLTTFNGTFAQRQEYASSLKDYKILADFDGLLISIDLKMQIFFKNRESARSVKSGKIQDNGKDSIKRWSRFVEVKPTQKETMPLTCTKDYRYSEKAKTVQVLKVKKNKLK